jgi:hypothetical protein
VYWSYFASQKFTHTLPGKLHFPLWRFPRCLDKAVQKPHFPIRNTEQHTGNALAQAGSHLKKSFAERAA